MEDYQGGGLVDVKSCEPVDGDQREHCVVGVPGQADTMATTMVTPVTSVINNNNNNTKFSRCEGCGELILDR